MVQLKYIVVALIASIISISLISHFHTVRNDIIQLKQLRQMLRQEQSPNRIIQFSNYSWYVRVKNAEKQGPGPNYFNDNQSNVWLDANSHLHLKITNQPKQNKWYCAEVFTQKSFGYGSYVYNVEKGFQLIDPRTVVGLFNYLDDNHEIDVQLSQWGDPNIPNTQFVVQPYNIEGNIQRFKMVNMNSSVIHAYTWKEKEVFFQSFYANTISQVQKEIGIMSQSQKVVKQWKYTGKYIPQPNTEKVHLNLWLFEGKLPLNGKNQQVTIKQFKYLQIKN